MYRRALKRGESVLGTQHPDTSATVDDLASVLRDQEKYQEAEKMDRRHWQEERVSWEPSIQIPWRPWTAWRRCSAIKRSIRRQRGCIGGHWKGESVLGTQHPDTLATVDSLALVLYDQEKYQEIERMHRWALAGRSVLGLGIQIPWQPWMT